MSKIPKTKSCCVFGHRIILARHKLLPSISEHIETMIKNDGVKVFYFSGLGDFDEICRVAINNLKISYPYIKSVYVQADYNHTDKVSIHNLKNLFDDVIYSENNNKSKLYTLTACNQKIVEMSDICLFFVGLDYGGAYRALCHAIKKNKKIINIYTL